MQILCSPFSRKSRINQGHSKSSGRTNQDYPSLRTEVVDRVPHLRAPIHLRLDQPLLFVLIINFTIISFRVGEHIAIVVDSWTCIGGSDVLILAIALRNRPRVDSFPELRNRWPVRETNPR